MKLQRSSRELKPVSFYRVQFSIRGCVLLKRRNSESKPLLNHVNSIATRHRCITILRKEDRIDLVGTVRGNREFGDLSRQIYRAEVNLVPELRTLGERN